MIKNISVKKNVMTLLICIFLSCGDNDEFIKVKRPNVDEIVNVAVEIGSELIITGKDLDNNPVIVLNNETIIPTKVTSSSIHINIPVNATSGKLEIKFEEENYNVKTFLKVLDTGWKINKASNYFQIKFASENVGFAKRSESGKDIIDKTLDGGKTWVTVLEDFSPTGELEVVSDQVVFIRTTSNTMKKTTNGGATWQDIEALSIGQQIGEVFFKDDLEGYLIGRSTGETFVNKTNDGGNSWSKILTIEAPLHKIELAYNKDDVVILLDRENNKLIRTEDAGVTWYTVNSNFETPYPIIYNFLNKNTALLYMKRFFDSDYEFVKTNDQATTWVNIEIPKLSETIVRITFLNDSKIHLLTDKGSSLYSLNGGETWKHYHINSEHVTAATNYENKVYVIANDKLLIKEL